MTAVLITIFGYIYRKTTGFEGIDVLSPLILFTGVPMLLIISGGIYYLLVHYVANGERLYLALVIICTLASIAFVLSSGAGGFTVPHGLLAGALLITGLADLLLLPFLVHHPKLYLTSDQMKWENDAG